jgi:hypothetical protein
LASPREELQGTEELVPADITADVPGTVLEHNSRYCSPDVLSVHLSIAEGYSKDGSGYRIKEVKGGKVTFELTFGGKEAFDTASVTFEGPIHPLALIVNTTRAASLQGVKAKKVAFYGDTFGEGGRIFGVTVCLA